jgi:hypothetical protein
MVGVRFSVEIAQAVGLHAPGGPRCPKPIGRHRPISEQAKLLGDGTSNKPANPASGTGALRLPTPREARLDGLDRSAATASRDDRTRRSGSDRCRGSGAQFPCSRANCAHRDAAAALDSTSPQWSQKSVSNTDLQQAEN